jgi:hypothetical protein
MAKRIIAYVLMALGAVALGAYFWFTAKLEREAASKRVCRAIEVTVADSAENRFVRKQEVKDIVQENFNVKGRKLSEINCGAIETLLDTRSAIKSSEAYSTEDGVLHVSIRQRRPVARIQMEDVGFYIDETGWVFPLQRDYTSYVTMVTGDIPLKVDKYTRGKLTGEDGKWIDKLLPFVEYVAGSDFWSAQIEQVAIVPNGDALICPRTGKQRIIFGGFEDYEVKLAKLDAFYRCIVPEKGWDRYSEVNLKYKNQIICK